MGLLDTMKDMLAQYTSGTGGENAEADFHKLAQSADAGTLAQGIAEVIRSDQTPPFAQIVSQLFANASPDQKTAMVKALLSAVPAEQQSQIAAMMGGPAAGTTPPGAPSTMVSKDTVASMAQRAEQTGPGVIEAMSNFYAQHPTLVKTLGTTAMVIAMRKIAERHSRNA
ncbi:MAG TPA: hypothetical protein VF219_08075 [Vicinamibacterales bacterium]